MAFNNLDGFIEDGVEVFSSEERVVEVITYKVGFVDTILTKWVKLEKVTEKYNSVTECRISEEIETIAVWNPKNKDTCGNVAFESSDFGSAKKFYDRKVEELAKEFAAMNARFAAEKAERDAKIQQENLANQKTELEAAEKAKEDAKEKFINNFFNRAVKGVFNTSSVEEEDECLRKVCVALGVGVHELKETDEADLYAKINLKERNSDLLDFNLDGFIEVKINFVGELEGDGFEVEANGFIKVNSMAFGRSGLEVES